MAIRVPPPPSSNSDITSNQWSQWFTAVRSAVAGTGGIAWSSIDFTGSNLTSLATKRHQDLDSLQGGTTNEYYHLTSAQTTGLTTGIETSLHKHDFNYITLPTSSKIGTPTTISTLEDCNTYFLSAGAISGCVTTDNGDGTVAVSAGEALLRSGSTDTSPMDLVSIAANSAVSLTDNSVNYIYADYASGSPTIAVTTSLTGFDCLTKCLISVVSREGTHLHIIDASKQNVDSNRKHRRKLLETIPFAHIEGGCAIGLSGRYVTVSAGGFYFGLEKLTHNAFDTTGTDTFYTYYRDAPSGWVKSTGITQFPNTQYDDGSGTLATLGNNKYGIMWVYIVMGSAPHLCMVYGQAEYATAGDASLAGQPSSLPPVFESTTLLIGRIIFEKSAATATAVDSAFSTMFSNSAVSSHNNLSGLQGGTLSEYYHLTSAQNSGLTGGGTTTLHKHDIGTPTAGAGLTLDTTNYVLVNIGGVDYKLAIVV